MVIEYASNLLIDISIYEVTDAFFCVIAGGFIIVFGSLMTNRKWKIIEVSPSLFTTIGILGTFFGIFIGLLNFDPQNHETIDKSIPFLLSGLKTAFFTSVMGITASILMKFFISLRRSVSKKDEPEDEVQFLMSKLDAGNTSLNGINENMQELNKKFDELKKVVAGDEDATVVTQIQKTRNDLRDGFIEMNKSLNTINGEQINLKDNLRESYQDLHLTIQNIYELIESLQKDSNQDYQESIDQLKSDLGEMKNSFLHVLNTMDITKFNSFYDNFDNLNQSISDALVVFKGHALDIVESSKNIFHSISGSDGSTIYEAFSKTRGEIKEHFEENKTNFMKFSEEIRSDFHDFAEKVTEISSKQLIEALNDLIRDFNEKLTEQFGDNFRRLDESVGKLLEWQENYKQQLAEMKQQYDLSVQSIEECKSSLASIRQDSERIPETMNQLQTIMTTADAQLSDLERHLEAFKEMKEKAVEAMPAIKEQLDQTMESIQGSVSQATHQYNQLLADSNEFLNDFKNSSNELQTRFVDQTTDMIDWITAHLKDTANDIVSNNENALEILQTGMNQMEKVAGSIGQSVADTEKQLNQLITDVSTRTNDQIQASFQEQNRHIQQLSSSLSGELTRAAREREDMLNKALQGLDQGMQQEISRALETMGKELVRISEKFVQDYKVLTDNMNQVVEQARAV